MCRGAIDQLRRMYPGRGRDTLGGSWRTRDEFQLSFRLDVRSMLNEADEVLLLNQLCVFTPYGQVTVGRL